MLRVKAHVYTYLFTYRDVIYKNYLRGKWAEFLVMNMKGLANRGGNLCA